MNGLFSLALPYLYLIHVMVIALRVGAALLFAPIWGRISDRVGRRPILILGLAGSVVFYGLFAYASHLGFTGYEALAVWLILVARVGAGSQLTQVSHSPRARMRPSRACCSAPPSRASITGMDGRPGVTAIPWQNGLSDERQED